MRMIYLVLITAMALLALLLKAVSALRAQGLQPGLVGMPEYGVLLTGSPEVPVIVNHSGRSIIGFSMKVLHGRRQQGSGRRPFAGVLTLCGYCGWHSVSTWGCNG